MLKAISKYTIRLKQVYTCLSIHLFFCSQKTSRRQTHIEVFQTKARPNKNTGNFMAGQPTPM